MKKRPSLQTENIRDIGFGVVVVLAHVLLIAALFAARRYFAIYPALIKSLIGLVICIVAIIDVVFVVGCMHKDLTMKIISVVLAAFILLGSTYGTYMITKVNKAVSGVIGTEEPNAPQKDSIEGVFVCRKDDDKTFTTVESIKGKIVGYVEESEVGAATVGLAILDETKIDYAPITFETYDELIIALHDGKVDVGIFIDGYRGLYEKTKENGTGDAGGADYTGIIAEFTDFNKYEREVESATQASDKNISTDPFNILLIGWSRTDIGSKVGLADAIIVASVNPKTYTVSMMSIARDSYVPISCYGGTKDKINSARGTSRACFIKTVEDYTGMKMDFYMEADYEAVVGVVDAIEGIEINNPVDFVLDGIEVPAGQYNAWGWQVLQFCRERHHMPNGDFDRQQHQKEVIIAIAEKLLKKADITLFLKAIEAADDKFSTNLTLNQLTGMFNMILQTKNFTGLKVSKLIDFHQLRLTGYADWYYNYSMSLPLWIYKIYQGSYDEAMGHAKDVLGLNNNLNDQVFLFNADVNNPYNRPKFYQDYYNEEQIHEEMPAYYPNFVGYTYSEAVSWATYNKVKLNFNFIEKGDSGFNVSLAGQVVSQSIRYGQLLTTGTNTLTVMGSAESNVVGTLPNWDGWNYTRLVEWAEAMGYRYALRPTANADITADQDGIIWKVDIDEDEEGDILKIRYYTYCNPQTSFIDNDGACRVCSHSFTESITKDPSCTEEGVKHLTCSKCGFEKDEAIPKSHEFVTATCTEPKKCSKCGTKEGEALGHDLVIASSTATCTSAGIITYKCQRSGCDHTETKEGVALGHDWADATCTSPKTCKRGCGATEGEALGHDWADATCTSPKTCKRCGSTDGSALGHDYDSATGVCKRENCGALNPDFTVPDNNGNNEENNSEENQTV